MCLTLYIGSAIPLAARSSPELHIRELDPEQEPVRERFTLPEVRVAGAHTGCSCGFPSVGTPEPTEYADGYFDDTPERAKDLASVRALFGVIDELLAQTGVVELFPMWAGDEGDPSTGVIEWTRERMSPESFLMTDHFLYRITR